jgi:hypothetical protein
MLLTLLISTMALQETTKYDYTDLVEQAYQCRNAKLQALKSGIVENLVEIENHYFVKYDIPEDLRGMLLAAACSESGYNPRALGDWKKNSKGKKFPKAKGILQFWQWSEKRYNLDRTNPIQSAHVWMQHIVNCYNKNLCKPYRLSKKQKWLAAFAQGVRGRLKKENRFRCFERSNHWKRLKKWKKNIKRNHDEEIPGC